jgi:hypothetical protein
MQQQLLKTQYFYQPQLKMLQFPADEVLSEAIDFQNIPPLTLEVAINRLQALFSE